MSDPLTNQSSIFADKIAVWSEEAKGYVEVGTNKATPTTSTARSQ